MPRAEELYAAFEQFWEFVEENTPELLAPEPLHRVRENWESWWNCEIDNDVKNRIRIQVGSLTAAEQTDFATLVITRFSGGSGQPDETGIWVLTQLSHCEPFEQCERLREFHVSTVRGPQAVFLASHSPKDLHPLCVRLVREPVGQQPRFVFLNVHIIDQVALRELEAGIRWLLSGQGQRQFLLHLALAGVPPFRWWAMSFAMIACFPAALLSLLLLLDPYEEEQFEFVFGIYAAAWPTALALSGLALIWVAYRLPYQGDPLSGRQICVIAGGINPREILDVGGPSFGLPLALAVLCAVFRHTIDASLMRSLVRSCRFHEGVFTGEIDRRARIHCVKRLVEKAAVWLAATPAARLFVMPRQREDFSALMTLVTPQNAAQAAGELRISICRRVTDAILVTSYLPARMAWPTILSLAVFVATGLFWAGAIWMLVASRVDATVTDLYVVSTTDRVRGAGLSLHLCIQTDHPDRLAVRVHSETFRNIYVMLNDVRVGKTCEANLLLRALDFSAPAPNSPDDMEVRIVQPRRFLAPLPERVLVHASVPSVSQSGEVP